MQADFYQLGETTVEGALPLLAAKTLAAGERLLVVSADDAQLARISEALWARQDSFLAHGLAGGPHQQRQPVLLSDHTEPANGARFLALADGHWRSEVESFERVMLLFGNATIDDARATWRALRDREGIECRYFQQEGGRWVQAA